MQSRLKLVQAYKNPIDIQGTNATNKRPMKSDGAGDRPRSFIRMHPVEGSGRIVADAEERFEQAHAHREEEGR